MPQYAKGSKSSLYWREESVLGVAPTSTNYNQWPLNSETLDESISNIVGEDIRSDRAVGAVRGGNIATGGNVVHDFGLVRELPLLRHLLAAGAAAAGAGPFVVPTLAASTAYNRGDLVKVTGGTIYICLRGGTTDAAVTATSLTVASGRQLIDGASSTKLEFEYAAPAATGFFTHTLTAGPDFPTGGLTIEKAIKGIAIPFYVQHVGCRLNSLDLAVTQEGLTKATWSILSLGGNDSATAGGGTPTLLGEDPVTGYNVACLLNTQSGAVVRPFREFSLNITNQIDESVYTLQNRTRNDLPEGTRKASGNITFYFQDDTEYQFFKDEVKVSLRLSFIINGDFLEIELPEVKLTGSGSPKISGQGVMTAQMDFTAFKQTSNYDIKITARNKVQNLPI